MHPLWTHCTRAAFAPENISSELLQMACPIFNLHPFKGKKFLIFVEPVQFPFMSASYENTCNLDVACMILHFSMLEKLLFIPTSDDTITLKTFKKLKSP